jgi:hypothetical protein
MVEHPFSVEDTDLLKARLRAAVSQRDVAIESVRELVCALVEKMKAEGAPPEKVVIAVKAAVLGNIPVRAHPRSRRVAETQALLEKALTWCIHQYYELN